MLTASLFLLAGCKHKSGFEQLVSQMSDAKAIKSQYVIHAKGRPDVTIDFIFSKPHRFLITSADFVIDSNEADGHFEMLHSQKLYDVLPWDGEAYPGTGKLVPTQFAQAGPASGTNPKDFAPEIKWASKGISGGIETYVKTVPTMAGPQDYTLMVNDQGRPVKFIAPGNVVYEIKNFEYMDEQPLEKFRIEPKDNYVCIRTQMDRFALQNGEKFDWSAFKASPDVNNFKLEGETLFVIVDPAEPSSKPAIQWSKKAGKGFTIVTISKGQATSGFFDPDGAQIDKMTTTTPTFALVGKDGMIKGLWQGFDPDGVPTFEGDIQRAIEGKD